MGSSGSSSSSLPLGSRRPCPRCQHLVRLVTHNTCRTYSSHTLHTFFFSLTIRKGRHRSGTQVPTARPSMMGVKKKTRLQVEVGRILNGIHCRSRIGHEYRIPQSRCRGKETDTRSSSSRVAIAHTKITHTVFGM